MTNQKRIPFFAIITLLTLLANLVFPTVALADGETPPPALTQETTPTEELTPEDTQPLTAIATDEGFVPTDGVETETPPPTQQIILNEELAPPTDSEPDSVSEVLEQLPENTDIIVLDENGEALPLVTQAAEEAILTSDPMWCPDGVAPYGVGCSPPHPSMTDLLTWLATNNPNQAGTIWIEDSYDSSTNAGDAGVVTGFTLNGSSLTNMANHSLTIQGGWDGNSGSTTITGNSTFNGDYLHVINWIGNVTINNIFVSGATGDGIAVQTRGDINLDHVTSSNNTGAGSDGAFLENYLVSTGSISVTNSTFDNNNNNGVWAHSNGNITLNNVNANNNLNDQGALLDNASLGYANEISVTNSTFNNNDAYGLYVSTYNNITLNNVTANTNYYSGAFLENGYGSATGTISVTGSTFNGNNDFGLEALSNGNITLNNVIANGNLNYDGAYLDNSSGTGAISVTDGQFNGNDDFGLEALSNGNITLNTVTANGNGYDGISLDNLNSGSGSGDVTINNIVASNNGYNGVFISSNGQLDIHNISASQNGIIGVNFFIFGDISIINGQFYINSFGGVGGVSNGNIYIENVISDGHVSGSGYFTSGTVTIKCSTFSNNSVDGMQLNAPALNLIGSTFFNNGLDIDDQTVGGSTITTSAFDCNPVPPTPTSGSTSSSKAVNNTGLPLQIVNGNNAELDCDNYSGTVLILPNGDKVTFKCPIDGSATLNPLTDASLENPLPDDFEYASGMLAIQSPDGSDVPLDGLVIIDFVIPEELQGSDFAILYWDGTEWLDLANVTSKDFNNDGRSVYNGGYVTADGYFQALTNFSGNFVLVTK